MKLISWNVVSMRNMLDKANLTPAGQPSLPFLDWLKRESPDVICFQETKLQQPQIPPALENPAGYFTLWSFAEKKGYSGVATFSRKKPLSHSSGLGIDRFDSEGRVLMTEYPGFKLFNVYFPKAYSPREVATARKEGAANADKMAERLPFKLAFYDALLDHVDRLSARGEKIVICGDFNVAHTEIDLARPRENRETSGFLPEERAWMDKLTDHGYVDTFRHLHKDAGHYTWWSYRFKARDKDIGWRLDYFFISRNLAGSLTDAFILKDVWGSDHCPVGITLKIG
ncbi:MAG: exodeoxyribonuclease III [Dehalococcoidia bacterium]|nr:exodeoxyribonuclease III [Dehalococcoidia bacterium]MDD5648766.1 exodeoxyribonuclease III [Dehalococcoidia bacterium]